MCNVNKTEESNTETQIIKIKETSEEINYNYIGDDGMKQTYYIE